MLHRTLAADLFQTSIANGAFGMLLLNPPYDWDSEDKRVEHAFLTQTTRYLAESGLLVFIVPAAEAGRTRPATCPPTTGRMQCWAFPDPEREVFDQVVVFGYRKTDPVPDAHAEGMVMEWSDGPAGAAALGPLHGVQPGHDAQRRHPVHDPDGRSRSPLRLRLAGRGCGRTRTSPTPSGPPGTPAPAR